MASFGLTAPVSCYLTTAATFIFQANSSGRRFAQRARRPFARLV